MLSNTDKDHQVLLNFVGSPNTPPNKSKMSDSRHLEKLKNRDISEII